MNLTTKQCKGDASKAKIVSMFRDMLRKYEAEENMENRQFIADAKHAITEFEKQTPAIYLYIEGGVLQGASATIEMAVRLYDADNLKNCSEKEEKEYIEEHGTPEEWTEMIGRETEAGNLVPVF